MSDEIQVTVRWENEAAVIDLAGDVTTFAEEAINQAYQSASSEGASNIIFNCMSNELIGLRISWETMETKSDFI